MVINMNMNKNRLLIFFSMCSLFMFGINVFAAGNSIKVDFTIVDSPSITLKNKCDEPRLTINPTVNNNIPITFFSPEENLVSGWIDCYIEGAKNVQDADWIDSGTVGKYSFSAGDRTNSACTDKSPFDAWGGHPLVDGGGPKCNIECYNDASCDIIKECDLDQMCSTTWFYSLIPSSSEFAQYMIKEKKWPESLFGKHFDGVNIQCPNDNKYCYVLKDAYGSGQDYIIRSFAPNTFQINSQDNAKYLQLFFGSWPANLNKSSYSVQKQVEATFSIKANELKNNSTYTCYPKSTIYLGNNEFYDTPDKKNSFQIIVDSTYNEEEKVCNEVDEFDTSIKCDGLPEKECEFYYHCRWDGANNKCVDGFVAGDPCSENSIRRVLKIFGFILLVAKIAVPLVIIGFGTFDLFKAVVDKDEKSFGKQIKQLLIRILAGLVVFFIPNIINAVFSLSDRFGIIEDDKYATCRSCVLEPTNEAGCETSKN